MLGGDVLNAQCAAGTGLLGAASLHTADPGGNGANEDPVGRATLSWSEPADGVSTATANWYSLIGTWTHVGFWDGSTFVGSVPRSIVLSTMEDLAVVLQMRVAHA